MRESCSDTACMMVVLWGSASALVSINKVAVRWARLVFGRETVFGTANLSWYVTSHRGQLSLAVLRG